MYRQYRELKQRHPGVLLLFRLGDFYEMFEEDAEIAAKALELTLTSREMGKGRRVPMCGIPYHALDRYLPRLVRQGLRAAICEQVQDPKEAKGIVERDVVRVVTPGTLTEDSLLDAASNNYLVALSDRPQAAALAVADVSTGQFLVTEFEGDRALEQLVEELERLHPAEVLWPLTLQANPAYKATIRTRTGAAVTEVEPGFDELHSASERLCTHFQVSSLRGYGIEDRPLALEAAATALRYIQETQLATVRHMASLARYSTSDTMLLDGATRRNLELIVTLRDGTTGHGTLLKLLDLTQTSMGARLLRSWLVRPLTSPDAIGIRLDAVGALHGDLLTRQDLRDELDKVADLERLTAKASTGRAQPRDLLALRESIRRFPNFRELLGEVTASRITELAGQIVDLSELVELLDTALADDPPANLRDGGVIREGYSPELDEVRSLSADGKAWIAKLEETERQQTGISSLKVGYNQVFGYYLEVTKANLSLVPEHYIRKQTLANAERYISPELKEWEARILGAEDRLASMEQELYHELRSTVAAHAEPILATARALAELDVYGSLAQVAADRRYCRPTVDRGTKLEISNGRHPIVEATQTDLPFVPNDTLLDAAASQIHIITGPNMAGKSTYLRQVALISLLAQIGSYVPAEAATIGVLDRIFTRVGAQDDLATGQSTFMVEMTESANILHNATQRSLVVLDEIGRGTSTFDGLSIAWAVAEYLHERVGAKTLFATHYHDLNELESRLDRVANFRVAVAEDQDRIRLLHRIEPGGTDKSYGVEVARLAGLPPWVVRRARQILGELEASNGDRSEIPAHAPPEAVQLALFGESGPHPAVVALRQMDVLRMTPIEALAKLHELQQMAQKDAE